MEILLIVYIIRTSVIIKLLNLKFIPLYFLRTEHNYYITKPLIPLILENNNSLILYHYTSV